MDEHLPSTAFDLTGIFGGFVFSEAGKRRMLLRLGEHACLLKVPRLLRRRLIGALRAGETVRVTGTESRDPGTGRLKRVVSQVVPGAPSSSSPAPAVACVVRVCSKKNCWRQGGRELWEALGRERDAQGLAGQVDLRQVGCLDRCKQAPNADGGGQEFLRCSPADARAIIARAVGQA